MGVTLLVEVEGVLNQHGYCFSINVQGVSASKLQTSRVHSGITTLCFQIINSSIISYYKALIDNYISPYALGDCCHDAGAVNWWLFMSYKSYSNHKSLTINSILHQH